MENVSSPVLCSICLLISALYWLLHCRPRQRLWTMAAALPGPAPIPLLGNLWLLRRGSAKFLDVLMDLFRDHGPLVRIWAGDKVQVLLSDPDDIQLILGNTKIRNRPQLFTSSLGQLMGFGLITSREEKWRAHRKLMTPLFHFKFLETYVEVFGEKANELVVRLDGLADGRSFDVFDQLCYSTLESICETAIGVTVDSYGAGSNEFPHYIRVGSSSSYALVQLHWLLPEWLHWAIVVGPSGWMCTRYVKTFASTIITQKLADYRRGVRRPGIVTANGKTVTSFLEMLIEASEKQSKPLTTVEIRDEVLGLAVAGMETTATTMSFLMLLLGIHREIQQEVLAELASIFGVDQRAATSDDVSRMNLLDRVIRETLRLFPVAPVTVREIVEDVSLPSGHTLPAGCDVGTFSYAVQRNEKIYPQPNKFWPDRWLPENNPTRHPYAYLPFGAGPRNCIGQKYAMLQMKTTLSTLLRRYDVTTDYTMADLNKLDLTVLLACNAPKKYCLKLKKRS